MWRTDPCPVPARLDERFTPVEHADRLEYTNEQRRLRELGLGETNPLELCVVALLNELESVRERLPSSVQILATATRQALKRRHEEPLGEIVEQLVAESESVTLPTRLTVLIHAAGRALGRRRNLCQNEIDLDAASGASREAAAAAVLEYLRADPHRCMPTCRVGCPCDGGMQDAATGAPGAAEEIVEIVLSHSALRGQSDA